ncbi:unnamed protein product [Caenorhabditis brenneri]
MIMLLVLVVLMHFSIPSTAGYITEFPYKSPFYWLQKGRTVDIGFLPAHCDNTSNVGYYVLYGNLEEEDKRMFEERVDVMLEIYHNCTASGHTVRQDTRISRRLRGGKYVRDIRAPFPLKESNSSKVYDRVHASRYESPGFKKANVPFWTTGIPFDTGLFVGRMEYHWYSGLVEWLKTFLYF